MKNKVRKIVALIFINIFLIISITTYSKAYTMSNSEIQNYLNMALSVYPVGSTFNDNVDNGIQCIGFANYCFYRMYGYYRQSGYIDNARYKFENEELVTCIGQRVGGAVTASEVKNMFQSSGAGIGCIIQAYGGYGQHTMVLESQDANGINIYDCNAVGPNVVSHRYITWASLAASYNRPRDINESNNGISIYKYNGKRRCDTSLGRNTFTANIATYDNKLLVTSSNGTVKLGNRAYDGTTSWQFTYNSSKNAYKIALSSDTNKVMTLSGTSVITANFTGSDNQYWTLAKRDSYYALMPLSTRSVLDVPGINISVGQNLQIWEDNLSNAQKFKISLLDGNIEKLQEMRTTYGYIKNEAGKYFTNKNGNVSLASKDNSLGQLWKFEYNTSTKNYKITSVLDGRILSKQGENLAPNIGLTTKANSSDTWYFSKYNKLTSSSGNTQVYSKRTQMSLAGTELHVDTDTAKLSANSSTVVLESAYTYTFKLAKTNYSLKVNQTLNLENEKIISGCEEYKKYYTFSIDNSNIASIQNGILTARQEGTVKITMTSQVTGEKAVATVTITDPDLKINMYFLKSQITVKEAISYKLDLIVEPASVLQTKTVTWKSSNNSAVSVNSNGWVTGNIAGTSAVITASIGNNSASCTVIVEELDLSVQSITLDKTTLNKYVGETEKLQVTYNPSYASGKSVTWSSNNNTVATVVDGVVTARAKGQAIITAKTPNGKMATCVVNVSEKATTPEQKPGTSTNPGTTTPEQKPGTSIDPGTTTPEQKPGASTNPGTTTPEQKPGTSTTKKAGVKYQTHIQDFDWEKNWKTNGEMSGTTGQWKRLEAIKIQLVDQEYSGGIQYRTHVQDIGWQGYKSNGTLSGTTGQSLRLEAIQIQLTGEMANHYDIYYQVHAENFGWLGWAKNGQSAGSEGYGYRLEGIRIKLVAKNGAAPGSTVGAFKHCRAIKYSTHVQNVGWQNYAEEGGISGTTGRSLRLEGIKLALTTPDYSGGIQYRTHIENIGWENSWHKDNELSGTTGKSLRLEAIQIQLTGEMAKHYDVYYRVHAENIGWMGWAKNGASAGTEGYCYRLEAIQVVLVDKGASAPGSTVRAFQKK